MVIRRPRGRAGRDAVPSTTPGLTRVSSMVILGVTMNEALSFEAHVTRICCQARQSLYALRILVAHGLSGPMLYDVVRATTVAQCSMLLRLGGGLQGNKKRIAFSRRCGV